MIFLDNNSTSRPNSAALNYAVEQSIVNFENPSAAYPTKAKELLTSAREHVARVFDCDPTCIVFTSGGTESNNLALATSPELGDVVIGTEVEHSSVSGCCLEKVKVSEEGFINLNHLEEILIKYKSWPSRKIVAVIAANNETGVITDPHRLVPGIVKKYGARLHIDAVQFFGKTSFTAAELKADTISMSGHKIGAPKGVGALYIKSGHQPQKSWCGGSHEFGFRPGTENQFGILALGKVAEKLLTDEYQEAVKDTTRLRNLFEELMAPISQINGSKEFRIGNTSNLYFPEITDADLLVDELYDVGVLVSSRAACLSGMSQPSKVIEAMYGKDSPRATRSIRFSLSTQTTEEEIRQAVGIIKETVTKVKGV